MIHNGRNKNNCAELGNTSCELSTKDPASKFCKELTEEICSALNIGWGERDIVGRLLYTKLTSLMGYNGGLLTQFLHTQLDDMAQSFITRLKLDELTKEEIAKMKESYTNKTALDVLENEGKLTVDYEHASHAKFSTIIEAIKAKYIKEEK